MKYLVGVVLGLICLGLIRTLEYFSGYTLNNYITETLVIVSVVIGIGSFNKLKREGRIRPVIR